MTGSFKTTGVCSTEIIFHIDNNLVRDVVFVSGCPGNLQGISRLVDGMEVHEAIRRLKGIRCGHKDTSCPDQLTHALEQAIAANR